MSKIIRIFASENFGRTNKKNIPDKNKTYE